MYHNLTPNKDLNDYYLAEDKTKPDLYIEPRLSADIQSSALKRFAP